MNWDIGLFGSESETVDTVLQLPVSPLMITTVY